MTSRQHTPLYANSVKKARIPSLSLSVISNRIAKISSNLPSLFLRPAVTFIFLRDDNDVHIPWGTPSWRRTIPGDDRYARRARSQDTTHKLLAQVGGTGHIVRPTLGTCHTRAKGSVSRRTWRSQGWRRTSRPLCLRIQDPEAVGTGRTRRRC